MSPKLLNRYIDEFEGRPTPPPPGLDTAGQMGAIARMGAESVSRFTTGGHGYALPTLLDVLEQEAEDFRRKWPQHPVRERRWCRMV